MRWLVKRTGLRLWLAFQLTLCPLQPIAAEGIQPPGETSSKVESRASKDILTQNQQILHLLNRFGFGPKPGDLEKVSQMGVRRYLELQLHPERISDPVVQAKLSGLETLRMSSSELVRNFPPPKKLNQSRGREISEKHIDDSLTVDKPMAFNGPRRVIGELSQAKVLRAVYS